MKPLYRIGHTLCRIIGKVVFSLEIVNRDKIIEEGGAIMAMNHQSYLDPPLAGVACRSDIYFLARKSLLEWPLLGGLFPRVNVVPVNQERADMSALKAVIRLLKAEKRVIVFPEGARTLDGNLQPPQPGIGLIVAKTLAPVVPMRIFGAYEAYPRGAKFPKPGKITIVVGDPIHFTKEDIAAGGKETYLHISEQIMKAISSLELPQNKDKSP